MKIGETVMSACRREVSEETGIDVAEITLVGGSDAMSAEWVDMRDVDLAFDHARIFADAKAKLRVTESQ